MTFSEKTFEDSSKKKWFLIMMSEFFLYFTIVFLHNFFKPNLLVLLLQKNSKKTKIFKNHFKKNSSMVFRWEKNGECSRELWLKAGESGLLGVHCPEEFGGIGGDWLSAAIVLEEQ